MPAGALRILPVTKARWPDLVRLFGPRGACAGCWCMWPRASRAEFASGRRGGGAKNRRRLQSLVRKGPPPGLLAYAGGEPIGWCAVAPRTAYARLARSRVLEPPDDRPAWSVPCLFVAKGHRGHGVTVRLLREAARFAARQGARLVEGYPYDPRGKRVADAFLWFGAPSSFRRAGFREVLRRSASRPIMRRTVRPAGGAARSSTAGARRRALHR